jgi:hypothetical protein
MGIFFSNTFMNDLKETIIGNLSHELITSDLKSANGVKIEFLDPGIVHNGIQGALLVDESLNGSFSIGFGGALHLMLKGDGNFRLSHNAEGTLKLGSIFIEGRDGSAILEILTTKVFIYKSLVV